MVSDKLLREYAYNIYLGNKDYSFEKALLLFPKYYSKIKGYYQEIEAKENLKKTIQFNSMMPLIIVKTFTSIAEKIVNFHANRKEATDIQSMIDITVENIKFDKSLLDDYESLIKYYDLYLMDKTELESAINQQYLFLKDEVDLYNSLTNNDLETARSILTDGRE